MTGNIPPGGSKPPEEPKSTSIDYKDHPALQPTKESAEPVKRVLNTQPTIDAITDYALSDREVTNSLMALMYKEVEEVDGSKDAGKVEYTTTQGTIERVSELPDVAVKVVTAALLSMLPPEITLKKFEQSMRKEDYIQEGRFRNFNGLYLHHIGKRLGIDLSNQQKIKSFLKLMVAKEPASVAQRNKGAQLLQNRYQAYTNKYVEQMREIKENVDTEAFWSDIDLSAGHFRLIPSEVLTLKLRTLNVSWNYLEELPNELAQIPSLKVLQIAGNNFKKIPENIRNFKNLLELSLSIDDIHDAEAHFDYFKTIPQLRLHGNFLKNAGAPAFIKALREEGCNVILSGLDPKELERFNTAYDNQLQAITKAIFSNKLFDFQIFIPALSTYVNQVTWVDLSRGGIGKLAIKPLLLIWDSEKNRSSVTEVILDSNPISEIPKEIAGLTELVYLGIAHTNVTKLPRALGDMPRLRIDCTGIDLDRNDPDTKYVIEKLGSGIIDYYART